MRFKSFRVLLAAAAVTSLAGSMSAAIAAPVGPSVSAAEAQNYAPNRWFVQLANAPSAGGTSKQVLQAEKKAFRDSASAAGVKYKERFAFGTLWNGFSIQASPGELSKIRQLPGVTAIYPVALIDAPERGATASPDLYTAITMTGADVAQNQLGYSGKGIKVAIMDTGIDVDHVAFGGDGVARNNSPLFPTARVAYGYDFVGDAYNADPTSASYDPVPHPDSDPDDCGGHGTHVAGIVGANDPTNGLKGVAPEVTFGAYRVFGCEGSTESDIMLAAMERALADGMQVLNMSIGSAYQWPQYPTAVAASRLVDLGMVVVASIGNSGSNTSGANVLYAAGAPGLGDKVIGVASYDNIAVYQDAFSISPDNTKIGYTPATGAPATPTSGTFPLARTGTTSSTADACTALAAGSLTGKVALIRRGTCGFYVKAFNAQSAGAAGVVLYNNTAGFINPTVAGSPPITIPVVMVTQSDGALINGRIAAGSTSLTWGAGKVSTPAPSSTAGLISSFSSYGLSPDLALKPDIGAPGGNIWSTYPIELGAYANLSGTSMSSPHVAGEAALLLQAKPGTKAGDVRTILQNTAVPKPWWGAPTAGYLDNVHRQGAGMIQIADAILATTRVDPGKISLGEGQAGPRSQTLKVTNSGASSVTYDLSFVNALSTGGVVTPTFTTSDASVAFSSPSVTVPAGGSASVTATFTPATAPQYGQYGGYVVFTPRDDGQVYRVPFAGFVGDYQGIQAVTPTVYGFPWLSVLYQGSFYQVTGPDDWVYSLVGDDVPYFLIHFEHQVQELQAVIKDARTGRPVHPVFNLGFDEEYLPRNSTSTGFFEFSWDGTRIQSNGYNGKGYTKDFTKDVPDGQYIVEIRALKANGNPANPAHWETWTSPVIAIDRP
jgi:minor extracellular serine protease Vpr